MRRPGHIRIKQSLGSLLAIVGGVLALVFAAPAEAQEKRIALVIGNGNYAEINALDNSINDARLLRTTLQSLGFEVIYRENVDKRSMEKAIGDFATKLYDAGRNTVSLVYYAGHGVQSNGENFLLPTDVPLRRETDLRLNAIRAGDVLAQMEGAQARVKIVILDACRDNPFELTFRSITRGGGLADMRLGNTEFFIAYAATAGNVAWDGDGNARNSPYALALAKYLATPDTEISETFRLIRNEVAETTRGRQLPEARTTLRSQFFFNPKSAGALLASSGGAPLATVPAATPAPTSSLPRDPATAAIPVSESPVLPQGSPITVAGLLGQWCDAGRGAEFKMIFQPSRVEHRFDGVSTVYRIKNITPIRNDVLHVTMLDGGTDISEFGEFGADGESMTYLRGHNPETGMWEKYERRYKRCS